VGSHLVVKYSLLKNTKVKYKLLFHPNSNHKVKI